ncbi:MAG: stage III sporulation protein AB [Clostridia bacterium]|nr:stage III sporulation protein AB [Clostridia bacterium]
MPFLIKVIGFCFIVSATTLFGISLSKDLKGRMQSLNWFVNLTDEVAEKIRYSSAELPQIVRSIYNYDTYLSVDEPFRVCLKNTGLDNDDKRMIEEFFAGLGLGDTESQIKRCGIYKRQLLRRYENADRQYTEKSKLYKKLGFFGGLTIVIILI